MLVWRRVRLSASVQLRSSLCSFNFHGLLKMHYALVVTLITVSGTANHVVTMHNFVTIVVAENRLYLYGFLADYSTQL